MWCSNVMNIENVWMITFESRNVRKFGGLGEVPPNLSKALIKKGINAKVITPSHGKIAYFIKEGHAKPIVSTVFNDKKITVYEVNSIDPPHIIVSGNLLEEQLIYSSSLWDKIILFTKGIEAYAKKMKEIGIFPDIIHCNDWHSIPSMVLLKLFYETEDIYPVFIYHIHLLSKLKIDQIFLSKMNIPFDKKIKIYYNGSKYEASISDILSLSHGLLERFAGLISDYLVTVSKHYLFDVLGYIGWDLEEKAGVIYNATDWSYHKTLMEVLGKHTGLSDLLNKDLKSNRYLLRKYFEKNALDNIPENEPIIPDKEIKDRIKYVETYPFKGSGKIYGFRDVGPLAIMSGRITSQKGYDLLIRSLENLLFKVSNAKIVLFPIPVSGSWPMLDLLIKSSILYYENLRVIPGYSSYLYKLAHVAADVYIAPSRYEPFGIMVLEAMASGTPVVASRTGGLAETILDIREHGVLGTGLHIRPGSVKELSRALSDLLLFMESGYYKPFSNKWNKIVSSIENEELSTLLVKNPEAPWKIRDSCIRRASEFSWYRSAEQTIKIYHEGLENVKKRI
ncbi:MAG: glycosyl transferase family 1 [Thermoprotei archaeon]|nr:MAG: glycosyl transferase family 1 [Thermoprotei archaeon]